MSVTKKITEINGVTIEQTINPIREVTLKDVAAYLSYLKHLGCEKPDVSNDSINLSLAIAKGLGDVDNFGTKHKHKPLFAGGKTFHRNSISKMKVFFTENRWNLLALKEDVVKSCFNNCHLSFATELANRFSDINDVAKAYSSLNSDSFELNSKQSLLRNTMIANLLLQILLNVEREYDRQQLINAF